MKPFKNLLPHSIVWSYFFILVLTSCEKEKVSIARVDNQQEVMYTPHAKIGKKLENPYSISNISRAREVLNQDNNKRISDEDTHYYVRFKPTTADEASLLLKDSFKLYDFPFDYQILAVSDSIIDGYTPTPGEVYPWYYTVVRNGYTFPQIEHEILDTLYFPNDEEEDLDYIAHLITGNLEDTLDAKTGGRTNLFGLGRKPEGYLRLLDTELGKQPVVGAYVEVVHFGVLVGDHTDATGHFKINKKFVAGSILAVKFDNSQCHIKPFDTNSTTAIASLPAQLLLPATHIDGFHSAKGLANIDINFASNNQARLYATITNAVNTYINYISEDGLDWPGKITIYAHWAKNDGAASTPMLGYTGGLISANQALLSFLFDNASYNTPIVNSVAARLPDMTIKKQAGADFNSVTITSTTLHELGHTSHYAQVKNEFWIKYIQYIVANGGYGDRTKAGSERIALSEAWAEFISDTYGAKYYGPQVFKGDFQFQRRLETYPYISFIPYGIYYDLEDNASASESWDNTNGFTISSLYKNLTKDVTSPQGFRDAIEQGKSTTVQTNIKNVFDYYNWK